MNASINAAHYLLLCLLALTTVASTHKSECVRISPFVCVPGSLCGLVIGVCDVKTIAALLGPRVYPSAYE